MGGGGWWIALERAVLGPSTPGALADPAFLGGVPFSAVLLGPVATVPVSMSCC